MITVYNFLHKYCELRKLPPPTKEDLQSCGRIISHHFKHYWAVRLSEGMVSDSGFLVSIEGGKKVVVQVYPDTFKVEMSQRIDIYYYQKMLQKTELQKPFVEEKIPPIPAPSKPTRKRKIIPTVEKVASVKPKNVLGQIQGQ